MLTFWPFDIFSIRPIKIGHNMTTLWFEFFWWVRCFVIRYFISASLTPIVSLHITVVLFRLCGDVWSREIFFIQPVGSKLENLEAHSPFWAGCRHLAVIFRLVSSKAMASWNPTPQQAFPLSYLINKITFFNLCQQSNVYCIGADMWQKWLLSLFFYVQNLEPKK